LRSRLPRAMTDQFGACDWSFADRGMRSGGVEWARMLQNSCADCLRIDHPPAGRHTAPVGGLDQCQPQQRGEQKQEQWFGQRKVGEHHATPLAVARVASTDARSSERRQRGHLGVTRYGGGASGRHVRRARRSKGPALSRRRIRGHPAAGRQERMKPCGERPLCDGCWYQLHSMNPRRHLSVCRSAGTSIEC
jgi:hypothetical protein